MTSSSPPLLHRSGTPPLALDITAIVGRATTGMHRPWYCRMSHDGRSAGVWVVKPASTRDDRPSRRAALMMDLIGSELAARVGLDTPAIATTALREDIPLPISVGAVTDVNAIGLAASRSGGRSLFCAREIPRVPDLDAQIAARRARSKDGLPGGFLLFAFDAFMLHIDREATNPNALLRRGRVVAIDHGHILPDLEQLGQTGGALARRASLAFDARAHVSYRAAAQLEERESAAFSEAINGFDDASIEATVARFSTIAEVQLEGIEPTLSARLVSFLKSRRAMVSDVLASVHEALEKAR